VLSDKEDNSLCFCMSFPPALPTGRPSVSLGLCQEASAERRAGDRQAGTKKFRYLNYAT